MERLTKIASRLDAHAMRLAEPGLEPSAEIDPMVKRLCRLLEEPQALFTLANSLLRTTDAAR